MPTLTIEQFQQLMTKLALLESKIDAGNKRQEEYNARAEKLNEDHERRLRSLEDDRVMIGQLRERMNALALLQSVLSTGIGAVVYWLAKK